MTTKNKANKSEQQVQSEVKTETIEAVVEAEQEQSVQELDSVSSHSSESSHDYKQLDSFLEESELSETHSENSEQESEVIEPMSDQDLLFTASMGVGTATNLIESLVKAPIVIPDNTKQELIQKAVPVVKKHMGNGQMPTWLAKWQEELALGLAVGGMLFSVYKQAKAYNAEQFRLANEAYEKEEQQRHEAA